MDFHDLMNRAYREALKSSDTSTRIGALLVDDEGLVVARGHNAPAPGISSTDPRLLVRPDKYLICEHAERNVLYDAARRGVRTAGLCMVTPWSPCADCARGVSASGIHRIVVHEEAPPLPGWQESQDAGIEILHAGGVLVEVLSYMPEVAGILAGGVWHHPGKHFPNP